MNIKAVKKVKALKKKKLSYRQIAKLLDADVKSIYRWGSYSVGRKV